MHLSKLAALALLVLSAPLSGGSWQRESNLKGNSCCDVIVQALEDYNRITPGSHREEVEKLFRRGGGIQFPTTTRYTYRKSELLHIDVDFKIDPSSGSSFSPTDTVVKLSKLYVDYEPRD